MLSVSATIALGLALFGITAGSTARAAEIRLLSASALHPAIDALIPDFETLKTTAALESCTSSTDTDCEPLLAFAMMPFMMQSVMGSFMMSNLGIYCAEAKHSQ